MPRENFIGLLQALHKQVGLTSIKKIQKSWDSSVCEGPVRALRNFSWPTVFLIDLIIISL